MVHASVVAIEYYLPETAVSSKDLAAEFPEWSVDKIEQKTGIQRRHIAAKEECSSDLAEKAALALFKTGAARPQDIDFLLLCTQSPDYFLPTTACVLQHRLGIPTTAGAYDFNLGCSGFIYGLGQAEGLISSGQAANVLLVTAETYSKFIHPGDKSVRTLFGDAAAATLITAKESPSPMIGPFVYGTDGAGAENLIVKTGGMRAPRTEQSGIAVEAESGNIRSLDSLFMNGGEIFTFTLTAVPDAVNRLLAKADISLDQVDLFVFHQANRYMLDHLRKRMRIPEEKFVIEMANCGNTVSSTIPIALGESVKNGKLQKGALTLLVGFGVGYSWGATLLRWS
jgi:3-oxoacyl-[acyl-carrier-protein] synthase-3